MMLYLALFVLALAHTTTTAQRIQEEVSKTVGARTADRLDAFLAAPRLINSDFDKFRKVGGKSVKGEKVDAAVERQRLGLQHAHLVRVAACSASSLHLTLWPAAAPRTHTRTLCCSRYALHAPHLPPAHPLARHPHPRLR